MPHVDPELSTGMPGLDKLFTGLIPGDNIVWQAASFEDYLPFAEAYCENAIRSGTGVIYFRFARHAPLVAPGPGVTYCELHPTDGFEAFISGIHRTIESAGHGGYYLFDMLSDLATAWYSDEMLGSFFMLTCPYLYDIGAIAYFGLLQAFHAKEATDRIFHTAQIVLDVFRYDNKLYLHPNKVQQRYSPTMHMLHVLSDNEITSVAESAVISEVMNAGRRGRPLETNAELGVVNRTVSAAERFLVESKGIDTAALRVPILRNLLKTCFSRDERILALLEEYLSLSDALAAARRMIGTGLIGGKSIGMLLARAVLKNKMPEAVETLEPHDSFYVGSDVYYSFVVHNGLWWLREPGENQDAYLNRAKRARQRMLVGTFPDQLLERLTAMMDYYGQSPILVRSSSLLEDNFGNAFAGKYESVFCPNQGPRHKRLEDLLTAVRTIYASTLSEKALTYRADRGLLARDEQMALLVQRVSGVRHGDLFFPEAAGVGLSYNPYVWNEHIDPKAGVLRLVFGLGTRAVDRHDDDYTRIVSLNEPDRRPDSAINDLRRYAQRHVDFIDLSANLLRTDDFQTVAGRSANLDIAMFASRDTALEQSQRERGRNDVFSWMLTFDKFLMETPFVDEMRTILRTLESAYHSPVDVEFTVNFTSDRRFRMNIVQCRPLQVTGGPGRVALPAVNENALALRAEGAVIGHGRIEEIDRILYVHPAAYAALTHSERYAAARLVGRLTHMGGDAGKRIMLIGPGRWGTTTPQLGVPVKFHEIAKVSILCEVVTMRDGLVPDVSLGTHFFNDIVETDMLYLAVFPGREGNFIRAEFFERKSNALEALLPEAAAMTEVVRVFDFEEGKKPLFAADTYAQVAYVKRET